jgi:hypothetical protein
MRNLVIYTLPSDLDLRPESEAGDIKKQRGHWAGDTIRMIFARTFDNAVAYVAPICERDAPNGAAPPHSEDANLAAITRAAARPSPYKPEDYRKLFHEIGGASQFADRIIVTMDARTLCWTAQETERRLSPTVPCPVVFMARRHRQVHADDPDALHLMIEAATSDLDNGVHVFMQDGAHAFKTRASFAYNDHARGIFKTATEPVNATAPYAELSSPTQFDLFAHPSR